MSTGDGGKNGGIFAAGIAGLGMLLARGADDCARLGARGASIGHGASLADDVARGAGHGASALGDDALRGVGRGASGFGDDALRGAGRGSSLGDDALKGVGPGAVVDDELRGAALMEESMGGAASRSGEAADELAHEVAGQGLEIAVDALGNAGPDGDEDDEPGAPSMGAAGSPESVSGGLPPAVRRLLAESPVLVPLVPTTAQAYARVLGRAPGRGELEGLGRVTRESNGALAEADPGKEALFGALARHARSNPVGIIGYAAAGPAGGKGIRLALPGGGEIEDADIHRKCMALGTSCVVLACDPAPGAVCAWQARQVWLGAEQSVRRNGTTPLASFTKQLLEERGRAEGGEAIALSRLTMSVADPAPRVVRSRLRPQAGVKGADTKAADARGADAKGAGAAPAGGAKAKGADAKGK